MTYKFLSVFALACVSLSACAQSTQPATAQAGNGATATAAATPKTPQPAPGTPAARALEALKSLNGAIAPEQIGNAPIPGFQQAIVAGQVIYVSNDGRYLLQGNVYDIQRKKNVSEEAMAGVRREIIDAIPESDRIVFAPPKPKHTVVVFTDVECGYCRKLHNEIAQYNKQGIAVEYVAFPRMGLASEDFRKMEAVWCAKDRKKALTEAKNDHKVTAARCKNPVAMQYHLGQRAGLSGTPMILAEDGTLLGGYVPPAELRAALDKLAAEAAPRGGAGAGAR
jgi:thiol:disulfide interchange protein DsbC